MYTKVLKQTNQYPELLVRLFRDDDGDDCVGLSYWVTDDDFPSFYETAIAFPSTELAQDYIRDFSEVSRVNFFDRLERSK